MINEALQEIKRGIAEIIDEERLIKLLNNFYENGENYTIKAGFDPTAPDIHLGHTVLLQKLATFQKYGAIVQLLIGDFTATIGDPTGKNVTRKILSKEDIIKNTQSYKEQVFKILDENKTQVVFNNDWLGKLSSSEFLHLMTKRTVARMLERDDFKKRFKNENDIAIHEFTYPLLQGYDSVHLKSDIEIGGTDQKFNLLMGRHLQKSYNTGKQQVVLMMPILEGLDGVNKMSKSLGNYIGVTDEPNDMFAKILSISDLLMWRYYELLSSISIKELEELKVNVKNGTLHPKVVKEDLAYEIVSKYYDENLANCARSEFNSVHKDGGLPEDLKEVEFKAPIWVAKALVEGGIESSTSQARRDIKQGAFKLNQEKCLDEQLQLESGVYILQVGKKRFIKAIIN